MPHGKGMPFRGPLTGVEGTECLLRLPVRLPLGLDQVERILSPNSRHGRAIVRKSHARGNGGLSSPPKRELTIKSKQRKIPASQVPTIMEVESWIIWIIIGAIFIVAEIFSVSFFAGPVGLACLVAAILNKAGATTTWQLVGFSVTSVGLLLAVRPIWKRMMENMSDKKVSGIDTYVGRQGKITETVDPQAETGRIKIGGEDWRAVSDKSIIIEEGSLATVIRIEGSKAVVSVSENP